MAPTYLAHDVTVETRPDGAMLFRSANALGPVVARTTDWLDDWAARTPNAECMAERSGAGWRVLSYADARDEARSLAGGLLSKGLGPTTPILIISGNSIDHLLLTLAAQYVGIPMVPVAEQYALIPGARKHLDYIAGLTKPGMVFAEDGAMLAEALSRQAFDGMLKLVSRRGEATPGALILSDLTRDTVDITDAHAQVGPDTVAKILMTSGSTSSPKGVETTHRMMCTNQAQISQALPFLTTRPPRIVDWLPWNHVFGGSHNVNMMLANGGAIYVDGGKPVPGLVEKSLENLRLKTGTLAFNVPVGFARLRDEMRVDPALRQAYFEDLDMLFYAGASLPQDVWADLEDMAREVRGDMPLFTSSWGLTETAPASLLQHEPTHRSGIIGVPLAGLTVKLIPDEDGRCEVRLKGPTIFQRYLNDPEKTAEAFDDEGYFRTGDAMVFVEPGKPALGMRFDGRISEDFKLTTGTWVRAANLRLDVLGVLGGLAQDVIITGADREQVGLLILPGPLLRACEDMVEDNGALLSETGAALIADALTKMPSTGSAGHIRRALVLAAPPSIAEGEITAKGNLNFRNILTRRAALLERLYDDTDPASVVFP